MRHELKELGDAVILAVRGYVATVAGALTARLDLFELALKTLPKPEKGDKGDRGDDAPPIDVARLAAEVFGLVPVPKDGLPGEPGKSVTVEDVAPIIREAVTREVAALPPPAKADPAEIAGILLRAIAEMPKPELVDVAAVVAHAVAEMPKPRDGRDFDPDLLRSEVAKAVSALPPAEPGKDADPVLIEQSIQHAAGVTRDELMKSIETAAAHAKAEILAHADLLIEALPDPVAIAADVLDKVVELFHAIPAPKDGDPGKDADPEFVRSEVARLVAELPPAEPGKDADPAVIASMLAQAVAEIEIPKPNEVDLAVIRAEVERVFAESPKPEKGKDADPVDVAEVANQVLALVVQKIPPPKEVDPELLRAEVAKAFAEFPKPRDGENVPLEVTQALIVGEVAKVFAAMPKPKDGERGRDAMRIDIVDGVDTAKSYPRGTFAAFNGGTFWAARATDALDDKPAPRDAGWIVVMNGDAEDTAEVDESMRTVTFRKVKSSGKVIEQQLHLAVPVDCGIYKGDETYLRGDVTTWNGCLWIAQRATEDKPGSSDAWRLSVKSGRDGASAFDVARRAGFAGSEREWLASLRGEPGKKGDKGQDLTQLGGDGRKY